MRNLLEGKGVVLGLQTLQRTGLGFLNAPPGGSAVINPVPVGSTTQDPRSGLSWATHPPTVKGRGDTLAGGAALI